MTNIRLIARLDVKAPNLIKGVHLEGLRKLGEPQEYAERYYSDGIDELIYIDLVASLYQRNTIVDLVHSIRQSRCPRAAADPDSDATCALLNDNGSSEILILLNEIIANCETQWMS